MANISPLDNYSLQLDVAMTPIANMDRAFFFAYNDPVNWYSIHTVGNSVYINKYIGGIEYFLPGRQILYSFIDGSTYTFRIEYINHKIIVYINNTQVNEVIDSPPYLTEGKVGLAATAGYIASSEVWFDNMVAKSFESSTPSPSPTPFPTPSPSPSPVPTTTPTIGPFELPFSYSGRLTGTTLQFRSAFWERLTAAFDHTLQVEVFRPFTSITYFPSDCPTGVLGITCYDSHNGTDFSAVGGSDVYSVSNGEVVFASNHNSTSCSPNPGGFGCVVVIEHPGKNYTLYAHLSKIFVDTSQSVSSATIIGEMGETGCSGCGTHLHFGVMKPINDILTTPSFFRLNKTDWKALLYTIRPSSAPRYPGFCTYTAPNGAKFAFVDPSGWMGLDKDPWSEPRTRGGCGIRSKYLWKFNIGLTP